MKGQPIFPGIKSKHAVVTPTCRANKGRLAALREAIGMMEQAYEGLVDAPANEDATFHFILTVERPK